MKQYVRARPASFEHEVVDRRTGQPQTVPRQHARRSTLAFAIEAGRLRLHLTIERAISATGIVPQLARAYASAALDPKLLAALEAQLTRGLEDAGYRTRPGAPVLAPATETVRTPGGRVFVGWSPLSPNQDAIELLVENVVPVDATALVLGQPYEEDVLREVEWEEGMPTWSLVAALSVLAIAGHPTLRTIEIESSCAEEGVAIGDPALLFAALPRLEKITNGPSIVRR